MTYRVVVTSKARIAANEAVDWWAKNRSALQAGKWFDRFNAVVASLAFDPDRCPVAQENDELPIEVREIAFGVGSRKTHRLVLALMGTLSSSSRFDISRKHHSRPKTSNNEFSL